MTWVYLTNNKSDYLETLMKFEEYVFKQFNKIIQIIRSDNALEFTDRECTKYLTGKGIVHQKTCPYTSQ